ncbi:UNVERIFIED_CONTAM: hypothetical protein K2H54_002078 [Gekko kuhli]
MATKKELKDLTQLIAILEQNVRGDIKALKTDLSKLTSEIKGIKKVADKAARTAEANETKIKELTSVRDARRLASLKRSSSGRCRSAALPLSLGDEGPAGISDMLAAGGFLKSPPRKTVRFGGTLIDILLKYQKGDKTDFDLLKDQLLDPGIKVRDFP